jgi:hypothetical protein
VDGNLLTLMLTNSHPEPQSKDCSDREHQLDDKHGVVIVTKAIHCALLIAVNVA